MQVLALAAAVCAEPEADPALLYANAGYAVATPAATIAASPLAYNALPYAAAYPWAYGAYSYASPYYAGYAGSLAYSAAALSPYTGYYGARLIAKREAEAEADPALLYAGAGYAAGLPYAGYAGYAAPYAAYAGYAAPYAAYSGYAAPYAYGAYSYGAYAAPYFGRFYA